VLIKLRSADIYSVELNQTHYKSHVVDDVDNMRLIVGLVKFVS